MQTLHGSFLKQVELIPYQALAAVISGKLAENSVQLSARQRAALIRHLRSGNWNRITFRGPDLRPSRTIKLELTSDDSSRIERAVENVLNGLPELIHSVLDSAASDILTTLRRRWPARAKYERALFDPFNRRLARRWRRPLSMLSMQLTIAREFGESINDEVRSEEFAERKHLVEVLTRLHAKACQVAGEVLALLAAGFGDGAMARWRSLHELAVTAMFIGERGEQLAERYVAYRAVEAKRSATEYQKHCYKLGYEPLDATEMADIENAFQSAIVKYGKSFAEPYGWAAEVLANPRPKFDQIERATKLEHSRPFYKLATQNVHANPSGVFFRLGLLDESSALLAGPSNLGLGDPGQTTMFSLALISAALIALNATLDNIVATKVMQLHSEQAAEVFAAVEIDLRRNV